MLTNGVGAETRLHKERCATFTDRRGVQTQSVPGAGMSPPDRVGEGVVPVRAQEVCSDRSGLSLWRHVLR